VKTLGKSDYYLICIGFSVGGIQPLRTILSLLPARLNGAIFILNLLPPGFPGFTAQVLEGYTDIPIYTAVNNMLIEPQRIYLLPPDHYMTLNKVALSLEKRAQTYKNNRAINTFLNSLEEFAGLRTIAILLSGSANDGANGLGHILRIAALRSFKPPEPQMRMKSRNLRSQQE
jgi:two-component system CheB/CheR fusion protein